MYQIRAQVSFKMFSNITYVLFSLQNVLNFNQDYDGVTSSNNILEKTQFPNWWVYSVVRVSAP